MRPLIGFSAILVLCLPLSLSLFGAQSAEKDLVLPAVSYKRLLNDLQVAVASTPHLGESMTIGLVTRYGSSFDPIEKGGLAYLVSQMFLKATQDKSAKAIQDDLDYLGASIEVRCDWDGIRFLLRGQSPRFERSLLLLYQVVGEALFNEADFTKVKSEILQHMDMPDDPRQGLRRRFETALYKGTTYGRPLQGTKASIQNISLGDVRLFYRRYLSPTGSALAVVGSAPPAQIQQKAARIWGVWVRQDEVPFTFLPPRSPASKLPILEDDPASPAVQFILGSLWPVRGDPAFNAAALAARLLQGRLTKALPTSLLTVGGEGRRMTGPFYIQGQAAADQAIAEIKKVLEVVETFKDSPVSPEELAEAQKSWIQDFQKSLGSTDALCNLMLDSELYQLGTNYAANFVDVVRRNTPDSVKEAARLWMFPQGVLIYVRGPAATLKAGLESLGSLQPAP